MQTSQPIQAKTNVFQIELVFVLFELIFICKAHIKPLSIIPTPLLLRSLQTTLVTRRFLLNNPLKEEEKLEKM